MRVTCISIFIVYIIINSLMVYLATCSAGQDYIAGVPCCTSFGSCNLEGSVGKRRAVATLFTVEANAASSSLTSVVCSSRCCHPCHRPPNLAV